ncbi:ABC transporter permease subunit [Allorhizocola rhizosphaerae]|uniref:ABC transporter permease subunit n=1 Tax=Allorhizocola rhizosphaerae TaxID=1872709 RepID=UPI000E3BB448|nr:ABC transporter permease subunit [Allorhizocola rhizosphaerae]
MNLIRAEVSRFFSRRFIQLMLSVLIIVFGITVFTVMSQSRTPTDEMWQHAERTAAQARDNYAPRYDACAAANPDRLEVCAQYDPAQFVTERFLYDVFVFHTRIGDLVMWLAIYLGFFGFLVMASFIGSELHSGGMTNLLLWRPNRMAVLGAKFGAAVGLVVAISAIFTAVYVGTFYAIASSTGLVGRVDGYFWADLVGLCARANVVGLLMSVLAFAIATVGRHTAAALGGLIGYVVVWELGVRVVADAINAFRGNDAEHLFLSAHVYTWLARPGTGDRIGDMTWTDSGVLFLVLAIAATATAFTTFRRRDLI